jgi:hypothetical protein
MRPSFSRMLRAVPAAAAVSGSVFASVWLLAINPERSQVPRAAAGASTKVVHASLPGAKRPAVEQRSVLARARAGTPGSTTPARSGPSPAHARIAQKAVLRVVPGSGAHLPGPAPSAPASPAPAPAPTPVSPAGAPPVAPSVDPGGSASSGSAEVSAARNSASAPQKGDKRTRHTQPTTALRAATSKPSGAKKAEPGQTNKQAAGKQIVGTKTDAKQTDTKEAESKHADSKQADSKQADTKQADTKQADTKQADTKQADGGQSDATKGKRTNKH